ncbi:MAG: precorrin-8X methylmutase [Oscillospiraceae bacterium]|nr:precorrin-8X methylmutase [Oscillospiraceae bacterium]
MREFTKPADIERESMAIIERTLLERGVVLPSAHAAVVKRVIHTTADFDYAETLYFTEDAVRRGAAALHGGVVVTDTNMALAGVNRRALETLGCRALCYMADAEVASLARARGVTRALVSMERALAEHPGAVLAIGNAPTALLALADAIEAGARPALVIGVPVGFVNVTESKERARAVCTASGVPAILAMGRKGGSTVAAAICNALAYTAAGMLDPAARL